MNLIIVESPTKSKTLQGFLGKNYKVLPSYGHVRDLPKGELGVDLEKDFEPKYVIPTKARKTIKLLKDAVKETKLTILATDEDREGEAIAWHLVQALGLDETKNKKQKTKNYERIVFHEITKEAIEEALKNPRDIDINLVDSQQARRVLDRIVGYKLSPFLWKKIVRGLSAGRVQSVAVRLVVEREREIKKFSAQEYWSIAALLQKSKFQNPNSKNEFEAVLTKKNDELLDKLAIKNRKEAEKIIKDLANASYQVLDVEKKEVKKNPLPPFTTSTLQQEAWRRFRFPAKLTMSVAQRLYETGRITYHRTDSLNLSEMALGVAKNFITKNYGSNYYQFRKFKTKAKGAQEAHEAIRPTYPEITPESLKNQSKLDGKQYKLYDLIWRRFLACQTAQAVFDTTSVNISASAKGGSASGGKEYVFRANGQTLKFDGFLKIYPIKYEEAELPPLVKEEFLKLVKLDPLQHFTQPLSRYTEATLIKALEKAGIGRPSTYAPILSTIQERNYIEKNEKRFFQPTEIGFVVNDVLAEHFPEIVDINFTANMEENLDNISQGQRKWKQVVEEFYGPFSKNLEQKYKDVSKKEFTEENIKKLCPKCQSPLLVRLGKFGKFYACSKFPKCKYTESLPQNNLGIKCPKCQEGNIVAKRTKRNKMFYGCDRFPRCDFALWDKPLNETCPKCGSLLIEKYKKTRCSNKECDYVKSETSTNS